MGLTTPAVSRSYSSTLAVRDCLLYARDDDENGCENSLFHRFGGATLFLFGILRLFSETLNRY
jgi:hypothetical protein